MPLGWTWCRLNELGTYRKGPFGSSLTKSMFVPKSEYAVKVYEQKNAIQKDYRLGEYYISEKKFTEMQSFVTKPSDIIVSCAGTIGETYLLPKEAPVGIINQALMRVELYNLDIADYWQLFFAYILLIENKMKGAGSAIKNIPPFEYLKAIIVPIPPLQEQKRIIEKFNELIKLICQYTQKKDELDLLNDNLFPNIKKSILQEAIQGKLVPQDPSDEPASMLLQRIRDEKQRLVKEGKLKQKDVVDSTIFRGDDNKYYEQTGSKIACIDDTVPFDLPTSWCWVRHNQLFEVSGGSQPPKSHFIDHYREGYIRLYQIRDYGSNPVPVYVPINEISKTTRKGDILLARYGGSLGKVFWAEEGAYNVAMAKVIPLYKSELIHKEYIFLYYCSNIYQSTILDHSRSAQAGFNKDDLANMLFPLPPYSEQVRIVERYQSIVTSIMSR